MYEGFCKNSNKTYLMFKVLFKSQSLTCRIKINRDNPICIMNHEDQIQHPLPICID